MAPAPTRGDPSSPPYEAPHDGQAAVVNGNLLALGAAAALAAGATLSRRGSRNAAGLTPGFRPVLPVPATHSLAIAPFFEEDVPSWAASPDAGLYHVTTNLPAVRGPA